jgi:hypothetical protein
LFAWLRGDPIGVSAALSSSDRERPVVTETASKNSSAIRHALLPVQIHFPDHVRHLATLAQAALLKKFGKSDVCDFFAEIDFRLGSRFCR